MKVGDPASLDGLTVVAEHSGPDLVYRSFLSDGEAERGRGWLLALMPPASHARGQPGSPLQGLADRLGVRGDWLANRDMGLALHRDVTGPKWSNVVVMLCWRSGCQGGEVAFPTLGVALDAADSTVARFAGQELLHGVCPFTLDEAGYRLTVVFYG